MTILMFMNLKGGVAKTTNAVAVAECLAAEKNKRVLVIDADHQCAASEMLLGAERYIRCDTKGFTLHDMLGEMLKGEFTGVSVEAFRQTEASNIAGGLDGLSVIPCSMRIDDFQTNRAKAGKGFRTNDEYQRMLDKALRSVGTWLRRNYDYTIIDCPPSVALQVRLFLRIATGYIMPCVPDRLSVRGSLLMMDRIRRSNMKTPCIGTLWSLYRKKNTIHKQTIEDGGTETEVNGESQSSETLPNPFKTIIQNSTAIARANEESKPRFFKKRKPASFKTKYGTDGAKLFCGLCDEIVDRCNAVEQSKTKDRR